MKTHAAKHNKTFKKARELKEHIANKKKMFNRSIKHEPKHKDNDD